MILSPLRLRLRARSGIEPPTTGTHVLLRAASAAFGLFEAPLRDGTKDKNHGAQVRTDR